MSKPPVIQSRQEELAWTPQQLMVAVNRPDAPLGPDRSRKSNRLGITGFVISLIGLVPCFALAAPVGLLFSLMGLFRRPRGLAVAGTFLGLLGSLWIALAVGLIKNDSEEAAQERQEAEARRAEQVANFQPAEISSDVVEPFYALTHPYGPSGSAQLAQWRLDGVLDQSVVDLGADRVAQVAVDEKTRRAFTLSNHELGQLSLETGQFRSIKFNLDREVLSWPQGVAIDSARRRAVVMTSHVFQRFFVYDLESERWSKLPVNYRSHGLTGLAYSEADNTLYAVEAEWGEDELTSIRCFNARGGGIGQISLSPAIPLRKVFASQDCIQLKYSSGQLVLVLSPGLCSSTAEVFSIDPETGHVASATWIPPQPVFAATTGPEFDAADFEPMEGVDSQVTSTRKVTVRHVEERLASSRWIGPLAGFLVVLIALSSGQQLIVRTWAGADAAVTGRASAAPTPTRNNETFLLWLGRVLDVSFVVAALVYPILCVVVTASVRFDVGYCVLIAAIAVFVVSLPSGVLGHVVYRYVKTPFTVLAVSFTFWCVAFAVLCTHLKFDLGFLTGPLVVFSTRGNSASANLVLLLLSLPVVWPMLAHAIRPRLQNAVLTAFAVTVWCLCGLLSL